MMHQGLDLSKFRKVSSDKTTSVLRHAKGHEIRIAHSAISPKMREQLDRLPTYMAGGGGPNDPAALDPDSPAAVTDAPAAATPDDGPDDEPNPDAPAAATPDDGPDDEPNPDAAPVHLDMNGKPLPPKPAVMPAGDIIVAPGQRRAPTELPPQPINSADLKAKADAWHQDLINGHITPETYESLFAKKDTLGKIGSLFGLLLAGAGSGLSHQPNAVLGMMDRQISNDLDAQKASKNNAVNYMRANQQNELNKAQIARWLKEGVLTDAQAHLAYVEANQKSYTLARTQMNSAALHSLVLQVNKMAPGSTERQAAEQKLALLTQGIQGENYNLADKAEAAGALGRMAFGQGQTAAGNGDEGAFQQGQGVLRLSGNGPLADDRAARYMPGIPGMASVPLSGGDREQVTQGVSFQKQLQRFMDWTKTHSGDLNPTDRKTGEAMAAQLQGAYRLATKGGVYKEGEQGFISNIIDSEPTKFFNKVRVLPQLRAVQKESQDQLNTLLKSKGLQSYQPEGAPKEGATGTFKDPKTGQPVRAVYKSGKWMRQ